MAVPTLTLDMDLDTLLKTFNGITDRPEFFLRALAGLGVLFERRLTLSSPGCHPTGDTLGASGNIQFGSVPYPPSDTSSHVTQGATEKEEEITPDPSVQTVETRAVADEVMKHKDDDKKKRRTDFPSHKARNRTGYERRKAQG